MHSEQVRVLIAVVLLWAGRVLLPGAPALTGACYFLRSAWVSAPTDTAGFSTHWLPNATIALALLWALVLPALVLPVGSTALAMRTSSAVVIRTVLGRRQIELPLRKARRYRLPGEGWGVDLLLIRGSNGRVSVLAASEVWRAPSAVSPIYAEESLRRGSTIAVVVTLVVWIPSALLLGSTMASLAGAFG